MTLDFQDGFSLAELLISTFLLALVSMGIFGLVSTAQWEAAAMAERHAVTNNVRFAIDAISRVLHQAGNDPQDTGIEGIAIVSSREVRVRSDLTGTLGPGQADKGDPDGDTADAGEDVTLRFNEAARTIEFVPEGGPAQAAAGHIAGLEMLFFDARGTPAVAGDNARLARVTVAGESATPDVRTRRPFRIEMTSEVFIGTCR